jgi:hypothetical protein
MACANVTCISFLTQVLHTCNAIRRHEFLRLSATRADTFAPFVVGA